MPIQGLPDFEASPDRVIQSVRPPACFIVDLQYRNAIQFGDLRASSTVASVLELCTDASSWTFGSLPGYAQAAAEPGGMTSSAIGTSQMWRT
jgi:hypothetical protein